MKTTEIKKGDKVKVNLTGVNYTLNNFANNEEFTVVKVTPKTATLENEHGIKKASEFYLEHFEKI